MYFPGIINYEISDVFLCLAFSIDQQINLCMSLNALFKVIPSQIK